ncbi:MAG: hypothetical protein ACRD9Q_01415 [Nitrososphaeraceae archaeon]
MNKTIRLKVASMILFWFGISFESLVLIRTALQYYKTGTILDEGTRAYISQDLIWFGVVHFASYMFGHIPHIIFGYWLSKGRMKGLVLGISIGLYEIVFYLVPKIEQDLFTPYAMTIRILFAIVIFLIISGRKELDTLKLENWRPWKNPRTVKNP